MNFTDEDVAKMMSPDVLRLNPGLGGKLPVKKGNKSIPHESEADFQSWVIDYAKLKGFRVAHFRGGWSKDGKRFNTPIIGDAGFFDLVLVKVGRFICIELKAEKGKLSPEQVEWGRLTVLANVECYCWKPSDREIIMQILASPQAGQAEGER